MCMLAAAIFTRNDSRVSKSRTRQYAERAICTASPGWAGAFAAKQIRFGSCNCACQCVHSPRGDSPKRSLHLRRIRRLWLDSWGGRVKQKSDYGRRQAYVLNSSTTAGCRICCPFWAFQNHRSLRYRTQGVIMLSRARYSWPGSNYPVMLDDCSAGPPPSAASAAEASLPDPRPVRASFLSGVSPLPGSRPRLSMYAAPDMGPFSGACAAGFVSLAEKSSLEKNLGPFCCHKNTSFILTWWLYSYSYWYWKKVAK